MRILSVLTFRPHWLLSLALATIGARAAETPAPIDELFRPAAIAQVQLSPNGKNLGLIVSDDNGARHLQVIDLIAKQSKALAGDTTFDLHAFRWVGDERLVFSVYRDKSYVQGLYVTDRTRLTRYSPINQYDSVKIVAIPRARPSRVLVWIAQAAANPKKVGGLVELNTLRPVTSGVTSGQTTAHSYSVPGSGTVLGWVADPEGEPAIALVYENHVTHAYRFIRATEKWQLLPLDVDAATVHAVDFDHTHLWIARPDSGGTVVQRYDMDSGAFDTPVHGSKDYDLADAHLVFSPKTKSLAGLTYAQRRLRSVWFSKAFAEAQAVVDRAYPDTDNRYVDSDDAETRFLFRSSNSQQPGLFVLYDANEKVLSVVSRAAPWLDGEKFAGSQPISFRSGDGLNLEGYLTLPLGASKEKRVPLIVIPHGGPWMRDEWHFDPEVQFLAARGYAVLQPNYRGSRGYSPTVSRTPRYDFRGMSEDVVAATRAVVNSGYIDPQRVAVLGHGFGGYLATASIAADPTLFRCAVVVRGLVDWSAYLKEIKPDATALESALLQEHLGDDASKVAAVAFNKMSPANRSAFFIADDFVDVGLPVQRALSLANDPLVNADLGDPLREYVGADQSSLSESSMPQGVAVGGRVDSSVGVTGEKAPAVAERGANGPSNSNRQSRRLLKALSDGGASPESYFATNPATSFDTAAGRTELYHRIDAFLQKSFGPTP